VNAAALRPGGVLLVFFASFLALIANGRAIGSGDTNAMERTTGALLEHGSVVVPDGDASDPFTRPVSGGRLSIYPVLPALLAAPVFLVCNLFFDLNPAGLQAAGKLSAALLTALATALLARSFSRRTSAPLAMGAALLFCLGTSAFSTAQALWQHPAVLLFLVIAIDSLARIDEADPGGMRRPAMVAALCLSLAAAARPAVIPMTAVLFLFLLSRARPLVGVLIGVALIPALGVALYNAFWFGAPWRFGPAGLSGRFFSAFPESLAGLLISPARGLFVFTPLVLVALAGLLPRLRLSSLARALGVAVLVHLAFISVWNEWHGGESFGPRMLTDLLPALFFYLPEGLAAWPKSGGAVAALSVAIQLLGGWTYDYRWERLHQRGREFEAALWSWSDSPIAFALREGVVIQGSPRVEERRVRPRVSRFVPFGQPGSVIEGTPTGLRISGPPAFTDIRLERGARVASGWITLSHPLDALAFRAGPQGVQGLHLVGFQLGDLAVETRAGTTLTSSSGDFDFVAPVQLAPGEEVFFRAETGELRLARVEAAPGSQSKYLRP
jgi:hypothetical protein